MDTREQLPLDFPTDHVLTGSERMTLSVGDYACRFLDGTIPPVRFERKSLPDLFGTMTSGYPRFKREMGRATAEGLTLILLVESPLLAVLNGTPRSQYSGESMIQKLFTLMIRYRLTIIFCKGRVEMARYIREYCEAIGRERVLSQQRHARVFRGGEDRSVREGEGGPRLAPRPAGGA